jgi:nucleotide-binding universal stress UspA family protein
MADSKETSSQRHVIISLDSSPDSAFALNWALDHFIRKSDKVTLLHVFEFQPITTMDMYGSVSIANMNIELETRGEESAVTMLKKLAKRCTHRGIKPHLVVLKGSVKHAIVEYVEEHNPDMFLIASRGLGSVKRFFLGSVSDYCIHHIHCPIVVVKSPESAAAARAAAADKNN